MGDAVGRLTIHHLRVFLAVAHHRGFTRAAGELGLTQAAVSAQVRDMARILGAPLFEVLGRTVALTPAGEDLEPRAAAAVRLFAEIGEHFAALRGAGAGRIRLGASSSVGTYVLPGLLAMFEKSYPGVEITLEILNSALIEDRVVANDFDLGFVGHAPASADLEGEQFLEDIEQEKRKGSFARLATVEAGCYLGEADFFDNNPRTNSAIAIQDTLALRLRREPLIALARRYPDLSLELINVLSVRLREANDRIAELTRTRPRELHKLYDALG